MAWRGPLSRALLSESRYLLLEGAIRSAKTTLALWKVATSCCEHAGIRWWIARWTEEDTQSLLAPLWRQVCEQAGITASWRPTEHAYQIAGSGALVYLHGIRPSEGMARYAKVRGKTLAGIYIDQAEEVPPDYWPELQGRLSQRNQPQQIILTPNAVPTTHWIAKEWPVEGVSGSHEYIRVRVYDNADNLGPEYIAHLERTYPVGDPKRRTMLEGLRGLNVVGQAVYGGYFERGRHLQEISPNRQLPLLEAIDYGKHHPAVVWGQMTPYGGIDVLGGLLGEDLALSEFAPIVLHYRQAWFPDVHEVQTCCDPAGAVDNSHATQTGVQLLNTLGIYPRWIVTSNQPAIRLACIEAMKEAMRRRTPQGEAFRVHPTRWVTVSAHESRDAAVFVEALEGGYVWDTRPRSVGNKQLLVPLKDGWYEHGMNCLEYLEANFGRVHPTEAQLDRQAESAYHRAVRRAQRDVDEADVLFKPRGLSRSGYR